MNYKAGQKVKIRTWESMGKEYGLDSDGDIRTLVSFLVTINNRRATCRIKY